MVSAAKILMLATVAMVLTNCGMTKGKATAEAAVSSFHGLYNQGKIEDIWGQTSEAFKSATTKEKWNELMGAVQRKCGKVVSTTNKTWNVGNFNFRTTVVMVQDTKFESGQGIETFTFQTDGTAAILVGYNINSMDLIIK